MHAIREVVPPPLRLGACRVGARRQHEVYMPARGNDKKPGDTITGDQMLRSIAESTKPQAQHKVPVQTTSVGERKIAGHMHRACRCIIVSAEASSHPPLLGHPDRRRYDRARGEAGRFVEDICCHAGSTGGCQRPRGQSFEQTQRNASRKRKRQDAARAASGHGGPASDTTCCSQVEGCACASAQPGIRARDMPHTPPAAAGAALGDAHSAPRRRLTA